MAIEYFSSENTSYIFSIYNIFFSLLLSTPLVELIPYEKYFLYTSLEQLTSSFARKNTRDKITHYYLISKMCINLIERENIVNEGEYHLKKEFLRKVHLNLFALKLHFNSIFFSSRFEFFDDRCDYDGLVIQKLNFLKDLYFQLKNLSWEKFKYDREELTYVFARRNSNYMTGDLFFDDFLYVMKDSQLVKGYVIFKKYIDKTVETIFLDLEKEDLLRMKNNNLFLIVNSKVTL